MKLRIGCVVVGFLLLVLSMAAQTSGSSPAAAQVPPLIQFSNVATDEGGNSLSGVVSITFSLYAGQQGGAALWAETQNNVQLDATGHYSVQLGITKPAGVPTALFTTGEARWLGVQIAEQAEQPRVLLLSVPYALKAGDAATIGGLPPSAFVLAAPQSGAAAAYIAEPATEPSVSPATAADVTTTGGTVNFLPLFNGTSTIIDSVMFQSAASPFKIGINTATPATTLDVKGAATIRGTLSLPAAGAATATKGANSQPLNLAASAFNSTTSTAVNQTFEWLSEPASNDTAAASGTLNLLFGEGATKPSETGLHIASNGQITFAAGQTFPGVGGGTITGVTAGTDLTGGGASGNVTLNVDTTKVPQLSTANTFTGNQTVNGNVTGTNVTATEAVTGEVVEAGTDFLLGGYSFAFGAYSSQNAFVGFSGNFTTTGTEDTAFGFGALLANSTGFSNTAVGYSALVANTTGSLNTASGSSALSSNTTGIENTASGWFALFFNTTGSNNTANGYEAGNTTNNSPTTGSNNTFVGASANPGTLTSLNNATAIGANAEVQASNALVLGSISGVNNATASTNVGIGTTTPAFPLDVNGIIRSSAGGFQFPDGSIQTKAASGGGGTVTSVGSGAGLTGGPITSSGTLSIATGGVTNAMLADSYAQLNVANTFTTSQMVTGNLTASGTVTAGTVTGGAVNATTSFDIGGTPFAFGVNTSSNNTYDNAFLGFAGNSAVTGNSNTGVGAGALSDNTSGSGNTGVGAGALADNATGSNNTGVGLAALLFSSGSSNTAVGFAASNVVEGNNNTSVGYLALANGEAGSNNTALGYTAGPDANDPNISNSTAIGANADVTVSNAMVLGSINSINGATADTFVGIGTTAPSAKLNVSGVESTTNGKGAAITLSNSASGGGNFYLRTGATGTATPPNGFSIGNDNLYILSMNSGGQIGIDTNTITNVLTIKQGAGQAIADGWSTYSSRRWKSNIQTLHGALEKVEQLRGVSYDLKANGKHEVGVIAEEVGAVVPELVSYEENGKDARGVDYSRLTALLIEATKEQQREIQHQQAALRTQATAIRDLKSELRATRQTLQKVKAQVAAAQPALVAVK